MEFDDICIVPRAETVGIREPESGPGGWTGVFANPVKAVYFQNDPEHTVYRLNGMAKTAAGIRNMVYGVYPAKHEASGSLRRVVIIQ